jgi:Kef-type K+ transport system membrane component KefB
MSHAAAAPEATLGVVASLFILFIGAKIGEEIARRIGQPPVVGELAGGFVVGANALGFVQPGETAAVLAEIGVVILLFSVGLEVRTDDLLAVGRTALKVAVAAMMLPIIAGVGFALIAGQPFGASVFVGMALAATSIGVTSKVLADLGMLGRSFARVVLAAAIVDDVLALILIGIAGGALSGDLSGSTILLAVAAIGLVGLGFAIARRARGLRREAFTWPLFADTPLVPSFILMLAAALVSASFGLAAIVGAFVAGLIVAETEARDELEHDMSSLAAIFTPFFFAVTGAGVDLSVLLDPPSAALAVGLAAIGVATKFVGGYLGARSMGRWSATAVGIAMVPRGEVGIVVVTLGASLGFLDGGLFSALLIAVVLTTIVAPILLGYAAPRAAAEEDRLLAA